MDLQKMKTIVLESNNIDELKRAKVEINELICESPCTEDHKFKVYYALTLYGICAARIRLLSKRAYSKNRVIIEKARFFMPTGQFNQAQQLAKNI